MITIIDVAKYAGVSKSTVSLVLNKSPLVKASTREKVLRAMDDLHYVPNSNARGLSAKSTYCLGIVIMTEDEPTISYDFDRHTGLCSYDISSGIISALVGTEFGVIIEQFCSVANPQKLPLIVKNHRVDGVFIVGAPYDGGMLAAMDEIGFPYVLVGVNSYEPGVDSVRADPGEGARLGYEYLYGEGYRDILLLNCPKLFRSAKVRVDAVTEAAKDHGIDFTEKDIVYIEKNNGKSSYDAFSAYWRSGARPEAVLAANGQIALGAMRFLYENNVRIPDDISFVSYEDSSISGNSIPGLTTVNIHKELMGEKAAQCLLNRLKNPNASPCVIDVPAELVIRESVKRKKTEVG